MTDNIGFLCAVLGPDGYILLNVIAPILYSTGAVLMIPLIIMFIRSRIKGNLNIQNRLFYTTLIYFIIEFVAYILYAIWVGHECHNGQISLILHTISQFLYTTQMMMLLGIWFYRLYKTYRGVPSLSLQKRTIISFTIFYIVTWLIFQTMSMLVVIFLEPGNIFETFYSLSSILVVILILTLVSLYIYKMYRVYQIDIEDGESLLHVIRKTALLTFISVSATIICFAALSIGLYYYVETYLIGALIHIYDMYTNALCIFLSYERFDTYYYRLCGFCDNKCIGKCAPIRNKTVSKNMKNSMEIGQPQMKSEVPNTADSHKTEVEKK